MAMYLDDVRRNDPLFHQHILCPKGERHSADEPCAVFEVQTAQVGGLHLEELLANHGVADAESTNDGGMIQQVSKVFWCRHVTADDRC